MPKSLTPEFLISVSNSGGAEIPYAGAPRLQPAFIAGVGIPRNSSSGSDGAEIPGAGIRLQIQAALKSLTPGFKIVASIAGGDGITDAGLPNSVFDFRRHRTS